MEKSKEYYLGVICGVLVVFLLVLILRLITKNKCPKAKYDERQMAARGFAYRTGFYTLIACISVYALVDSFGIRWCTNAFVGLFFAILISMGAFVITAIRQDAYLGFNQSKRNTFRIFTVLAAVNLLSGILNTVSDGGLLHDGLLGISSVSFGIVILYAVIFLVSRTHEKQSSPCEE